MLRIPAFYVLWSYQFIMCFLTFFAVSSYKIFGLMYIEDKSIVHRISESAVAFLIAGYAFWSLLTSRLSYKFSQIVMLIVWGLSIATLPSLMATKHSDVFYAISIYILHICLAGHTVFTLIATFKLFGMKSFAINFALVTSAEVPGGIIFDILATELQLNKHMYGGLYIAIAFIVCGLILTIFIPDPFAPTCLSSLICMRSRKRDEGHRAYNGTTEDDGLSENLANV
uniref:Uncharacterized protein n=3 Tax=Schistocephalus solidus TaxID=70667 RepID=A0A0X3NK97_SCHSO